MSNLSHISFFIHSKNRLVKIEFKCEHNSHRSRYVYGKTFMEGKMQQLGTIVMKDTVMSSKKGKSRSTYNQLANTTNNLKNKDGTITSLPNGRKPNQNNRSHTCCPESSEDQCKVQFTIFWNFQLVSIFSQQVKTSQLIYE